MAIKIHPSICGHPGEWLRTEVVEARGLSVTDAAKRLSMTDSELSALLAGQSDLTGIAARRFENAFGVKADTLMRMQAAYALARAG
jgi:addiction module HigA family antidote